MFAAVFKGVGGYLGKRKMAKNRAAWDAYNNKMALIQAGQSQNAVTDNVAINRAQKAENDLIIKTSRLVAAAKVKAGAAAAGVSGGSVEATLFDVGRNAGRKLAQSTDQFETSLQVTNQQRRSIAMGAKMSQRVSAPGPSLLGALATTGLNILEGMEEDVTSKGTLMGGAKQTTSGWDRIKSQLMI